MFCRNSSGTPRSHASSMKWAPFSADSREQDAVVRQDRRPDGHRSARSRTRACRRTCLELVKHGPVDEPRDHLADVVRLARVVRDDPVQISPDRPRAPPDRRLPRPSVGRFRFATISRTMAQRMHVVVAPRDRRRRRRACARRRRRAPPPSRPRRSRPSPAAARPGRSSRCPCTITVSSHIAGTYAPPAVHEPITAAICGIPPPTSAPGCRRSGRSGRDPGTPRPAAAGTRRPSRRGRCTAGDCRGDLLRAQVLLHRHREVGAALHGGVVRDHDTRLTVDRPMPVTIPALGDAPS